MLPWITDFNRVLDHVEKLSRSPFTARTLWLLSCGFVFCRIKGSRLFLLLSIIFFCNSPFQCSNVSFSFSLTIYEEVCGDQCYSQDEKYIVQLSLHDENEIGHKFFLWICMYQEYQWWKRAGRLFCIGSYARKSRTCLVGF